MDEVLENIVEFILRVMGAFGACWAFFSAVDVAKNSVFGGDKNYNLMENDTYARSALAVSSSASILSAYVLMRNRCKKNKTIQASVLPATPTRELNVVESTPSLDTKIDVRDGGFTSPFPKSVFRVK